MSMSDIMVVKITFTLIDAVFHPHKMWYISLWEGGVQMLGQVLCCQNRSGKAVMPGGKVKWMGQIVVYCTYFVGLAVPHHRHMLYIPLFLYIPHTACDKAPSG